MKFNTILSVSFAFAFAYAQIPFDNDIPSDLEGIPDTSSGFPVEAADAVDVNEYSDDYGFDAGIDALDINDETSDIENIQSNLVNAPVAQVATNPETITPEIVAPETTTPETTTPETTTPETTTPETTTPETTIPEVQNANPETVPEQNQPTTFTPFNGASGEAAPLSAEEAKETPIAALDDSAKTDASIDPAAIASGLVGAAALSSAGIFFMVKRAKRRSLESVRSQISMA